MPTFDYAALASTAGELLAKFGQTLQLRRLSGGTYNPVTGATTGSVTTTDTNVTAVATKITADYIARVGAESVHAGDRLYVLDDTQEPLLSDSLIIDSVPWSIIRVETVNPGGTALVYRVQVRA